MKKIQNSKFSLEKFEIAKLKSLTSFRGGGDPVSVDADGDVFTLTFTKSGSTIKCGGDTTITNTSR